MHLFAAGELVRDPESRTTQEGKPYARALLRTGEQLINLTVFDAELAPRLLALGKGDALAVAGRLHVSVYAGKADEAHCGLSLTVTRLMSAPARTSEAKPRARPKPGVPSGPPVPAAGADFDDPIPF